jgi:hypothetical protein
LGSYTADVDGLDSRWNAARISFADNESISTRKSTLWNSVEAFPLATIESERYPKSVSAEVTTPVGELILRDLTPLAPEIVSEDAGLPTAQLPTPAMLHKRCVMAVTDNDPIPRLSVMDFIVHFLSCVQIPIIDR